MADPEIERVRTLARVMDHYFVDPLIGLVLPGAGDIIGSVIGMYTVLVALKRKVSPVVIARMFMNLAGDAIVGFIPLLGDVFDVGFKANVMNAELLADRANAGGRATARDWLIVGAAAALYLGVLVLVVWGIVALVRAIG